MKTAILALCCFCIIGCDSKDENSGKSAPKTSQRHKVDVQKIKNRHGDIPVPDFVKGVTYTARIENVDYDNLPKHIRIINLGTSTTYFEKDLTRFVLLNEKGNTIIDCLLYSSYGGYEVDLVDLNGDEKKEVVFVLGEGRGPSVRRETLGVFEVFRTAPGGLELLYSTKYSDWWSLSGRWWYNRHYQDTDGDGVTDLGLTLDHDPIGVNPRMESPEDIPKFTQKVFSLKSESPLNAQGGNISLCKVETITKNGNYPIPEFSDGKTYTARIIQNPDYNNATISNEDWPAEDWLKFILLDETGEQVIEHAFRSSYGKFKIEFIDLNNDQYKEAIFILGEGRGTNVRWEKLTVYEVAGRCLHQMYSTEYMNWHGPSGRWWYNRYYRDINNDGTIDLELVLDYDPIGQSHREVSQLIRKEKTKVFQSFNVSTKQSL